MTIRKIILKNLIYIKTNCSISFEGIIILIKRENYCTSKLNNISKPLIFFIENK